MRPARLLFVGDLHLGRRPGALPGDLDDFGLRAAQLGPAEVWRRSVEYAKRRGTDVVVLAGDVVDRLDDRFEAGRELELGVSELVEAGIRVYAVVGNHDVEALPRLADMLDGFELIGRGGRWEAVSVESPDHVPVQILGWSFPTERVHESPLSHFSDDLVARGVATIGVLHCDVDAGASPYAPVRLRELEDAPADAWLLGHIHKPGDLHGRPIGYLGSMCGLDPGESGCRGPWWVEVDGPGHISTRHVPLAPIRYEEIGCPLAGLEGDDRADLEDGFVTRLRACLEALHNRLETEGALGAGGAQLVVCRVRVRGPERHGLEVRRMFDAGHWRTPWTLDGTLYWVDKLIEDATPDFDLDALARRTDPPGLLASRLVALRDGADEAEPLLERAEEALRSATSGAAFAALDSEALRSEGGGWEPLRDRLLRVGTRELEGLLGQVDFDPTLAGGRR